CWPRIMLLLPRGWYWLAPVRALRSLPIGVIPSAQHLLQQSEILAHDERHKVREKRVMWRFALNHIGSFITQGEAQVWLFPAIRRLAAGEEVTGFPLTVHPSPGGIRLETSIGNEVRQGPRQGITHGLRVLRELCRGEDGIDGDKRLVVMIQIGKRQAAIEGKLLDGLQKKSGGQGLTLRRGLGIGIVEISKGERF